MTILFDLDGTLLDSGPDFLVTLNTMLGQDNLPAIDFQALKPVINLGTGKMLELAYGYTPDEALRDRFLANYLELNLKNTTLFPGVLEMLTHLENKYNLGLVTNKSTKLTLMALKKLGIHDFFKAIVCGDTLAVKKPDPAPLKLAAQQLRVLPEQCIFIGDAHTDILAGKAAKMRTILVSFGYIPDDQATVLSWQADAIVHSPQELYTRIMQWT